MWRSLAVVWWVLPRRSRLRRAGYSVVLLESERVFGHGTSTRNSGVIHAGLYYPPGSLKAELCVEGRDRLYAFCAEHAVPFAKPGKLVVAHAENEVAALEALHARAIANTVTDVTLVDRAFIAAREPYAGGVAALWSPSTGIVEPEALIKTLAPTGAARRRASARARHGSLRAEPQPEAIDLETSAERIMARVVVNAAGLYADQVSALVGGESLLHLSVPRRVRGACAGGAVAGARTALSGAAHRWSQPRRSHHEDDMGKRSRRSDDSLSGRP